MNLKRQLCEAFCDTSLVREVPIGFAIRSPFKWFTGDALVFYARREGAHLRFEDSGSTLFDLETAGVDMSASTRLETLDELAREHGVVFDQEESLFRSGWVTEAQSGVEGIRFLSFMNRVQDMLFTTWERTVSTFKEDLIAALQRSAPVGVIVELGVPPVSELSYYTVDVVVRHGGKIAAVFPATSEQKALEAILFSKELELRHIGDVVPFLVLESAGTGKIHSNTQAKALNSSLLMAAWDGGSLEVVDKVLRQVGAVATLPN